MLSFQLDEQVESRALANASEPSLTLLPGTNIKSCDRSRRSRNDESYHAGIRALFGQLGACQTLDGEMIRTLGVTSCHPREGKSTIAAELARVAAESQRTLLVKADDPHFNLRGAMEDMVRCSSSSAGASDSLQVTDSTAPPCVKSIRDFLRLCGTKFDLVIVDLPAVSGPGCLEWAAALDGLVLVLESERVRWQAAARNIKLLQQAGGQILGSIINKRRDYIPEFLYRRL